MSILEVKNLEFGYGERKIIDNISFSVEKEQCFCIFGPNGCGKSTMLNCILGLNKPEKGEILIQGQDANKMNPLERQKRWHMYRRKVIKLFLIL